MTIPTPVMVAGVLETDVPCRKCSYNLRGLSADGRCPECGTPVGLSVQGDFLRYSDPAWLGNLRRGTSLIIWGIAVSVIGAIVMIVLSVTFGVRGMTVVFMAGTLLMLGGWWLMTSPDPSGIGEDRYGTARQVIRVALVARLASWPMKWVAGMLPDDTGVAVQVLVFVAGVVGVVGVVAEMQYVRKLALRIPDQKLSERAHLLAYGLGITYGISVAVSAVTVLAVRGAGGMSAGVQAFGCFAGIVGLAYLVFGIMYLLMVEKLGRRFKEQAAYARQTWAAGTAAQG